MLGQVIRRSEKDNQAQAGDPHEIWHRMSGRQMGYVGNNGNYDVTYAAARGFRQSPGSPGPGSFADFDLAHDHINSYEQGARGGVSMFAPAGAAKLPALMTRAPRLSFAAGQRSTLSMSILGPPRLTPVAGPGMVANAGINPRLTQRLAVWRDYQARGGNLDMQRWVRHTQGQQWGLGGRSGYADWIRSVESVNGNSRFSPREAYLYRLLEDDGFLKWGVTQDMGVRYSGDFARSTRLVEYSRGTRADMLRQERILVETAPGPLNFEPWAGRRRTP